MRSYEEIVGYFVALSLFCVCKYIVVVVASYLDVCEYSHLSFSLYSMQIEKGLKDQKLPEEDWRGSMGNLILIGRETY